MMIDTAALAFMKSQELRNRFRIFRQGSLLKPAVLLLFSVLFWFGLYKLFYHAFNFLDRAYASDLTEAMLYIFFFALTIMLVFSNAIICYTSFFKSREIEFLYSLPIRVENVFLYKFLESLTFSSWAVLFLATPLLAAYGSYFHHSWHFYVFSIGYLTLYVMIPAAIGAWLSMMITIYFPQNKKEILLIAVGVLVLSLFVMVSRILSFRGMYGVDERLAREIFDSVGFSRNPIFPSYWVTKGILTYSQSRYPETIFFIGMVFSSVLLACSFLYATADRAMLRGWYRAQGLKHRRVYPAVSWVERWFRPLSWIMGGKMYTLVTKDIRSFIRDPVQWSQSLIFFGILAIYFLNLRTFHYQERDMVWKHLIAQMNLFATALTLSTFISRFVFPQLSMEGRRFWILGMIPLAREKILWSKLAFSVTCSLIIGETLILISSWMLRTPMALTMIHVVTMLGICVGLSGLAVGLGAIYPNFREDNPSKIVSGFGGTLNLVMSFAFTAAVILIQAVPCYLYFVRQHPLIRDAFPLYCALALAGIALLTAMACFIPMALGLKAIRRMEV